MKFTKKELQACIATAAKDEGRHNLNAVRFETGCMVATDGYRLMRIEEPERKTPIDEPFSISLYDAKRLILVIGKDDECVPPRNGRNFKVYTPHGTHVMTFPCEHLEGEYPDYRQTIPTKKPVATVTLNAHYLKAMCEAAIKSGAKIPSGLRGSQPLITLEIHADIRTPVVIESGGVHGLVMPIKPESATERSATR